MAKEGIGHGSADTVDKSNISQHFYIDPLRAKSTVKHDNVRYKTIYWIYTGCPKIKSALGYLTFVSTSDSQMHLRGQKKVLNWWYAFRNDQAKVLRDWDPTCPF